MKHHETAPALAPLAFLLLAMTACGRSADAGPPVHLERLDGEWTVEFHLEHPATLTRDTAGVPPVRGTVVLLESDRAHRIEGLSALPTHYGVYSADLRALDLPSTSQVPTLVARLTRDDSVEIAFDPEQGRRLVGSGRLVGDSMTGHWWTHGGRTSGRSSGGFIMRRP